MGAIPKMFTYSRPNTGPLQPNSRPSCKRGLASRWQRSPISWLTCGARV